MRPMLRTPRAHAPLVLAVGLLALAAFPALADQQGVRLTSVPGIRLTTSQIMSSNVQIDPRVSLARYNWEPADPDRSSLPVATGSPEVSTLPEALGSSLRARPVQTPFSPQTVDLGFTAATLTDTGAFPPDDMGGLGPSQYFLFVNGRLRTFSKATGLADGVVNADPDVFFSSVMTPVVSPVLLNFTSDPQIRYDRLSGRWFMSIIDVPCTSSTCSTTAANRWLLAVSDAASNGVITGSTVWTFYWFQGDASNFLDYPSLGVDANALYVGGDMFTGAGAFAGTNGYVIRKSSVLSGGPMVVTAFPGLAGASTDGPFAPRGVDNYDPASSEGYFIGVSNTLFGELVLRRVSNPGGTPTISGNIAITVPTTSTPIPVQHLGNTGGNAGRIDAIDDRLFAAHIRNGRLWTAHNIAVTSAGVASSSNSNRRDGARWYELNGIRSTDNGGTPVIVQSGTIYDNAATLAAARQYSIPTVMVSGQGHAALGFTTAGTPYHIDAATVGRLVGDPAGTVQTPVIFTSSSTAYNPTGDPGGSSGRRWGDYSFVSLDPIDDMTMYTVEQFCDATNSYGCRVTRLKAPPPATPSLAPAVLVNQPSQVVTVTGTSVSGSGFYDPGPNLPGGVPAFSHLSAVVTNTGVVGTPPTVNSATYVNPTTLLLDVNTIGASVSLAGQKYAVKVTNPDGQVVEGTMVLEVDDQPVATLLSMFSADDVSGGIELRWQFASPGLVSSLSVERADVGGVEWTALAITPQVESGVSVAVDNTALPGQSYQYRLVVKTSDGKSMTFGPVQGTMGGQPSRFSLDSVGPNPTSGAAQIAFSVAHDSPVHLSILDVQGREIAVLADGVRAAGSYLQAWDGTSAKGTVTPGVYFVRYRASGIEQTRRLTIAR